VFCDVTYLTDETAQNAKIFIANVQATPSHRPSSGHKAHVRVNGTGQSRSSAFVPKEKLNGSGLLFADLHLPTEEDFAKSKPFKSIAG